MTNNDCVKFSVCYNGIIPGLLYAWFLFAVLATIEFHNKLSVAFDIVIIGVVLSLLTVLIVVAFRAKEVCLYSDSLVVIYKLINYNKCVKFIDLVSVKERDNLFQPGFNALIINSNDSRVVIYRDYIKDYNLMKELIFKQLPVQSSTIN